GRFGLERDATGWIAFSGAGWGAGTVQRGWLPLRPVSAGTGAAGGDNGRAGLAQSVAGLFRRLAAGRYAGCLAPYSGTPARLRKRGGAVAGSYASVGISGVDGVGFRAFLSGGFLVRRRRHSPGFPGSWACCAGGAVATGGREGALPAAGLAR